MIFSSIRNDIGSNFVERINEWFFGKRYSIYGKNGAIKYMTYLDKLIKFSYFPKHYNFHEIMLYSQYPSKNFQVEICVLSKNLKIFRREEFHKIILIVHKNYQ